MKSHEVYNKLIKKVLAYIEAHIDEEMAVEQLAKLVRYSPYHFHRLFTSTVGLSLYQYIKKLRLERAALQLRNSQLPVTQIALDALFDTPSAFAKAFKQYAGITPTHYRKMRSIIVPEAIEQLPDLDLLYIERRGNYYRAGCEATLALETFISGALLDPQKVGHFGLLHDMLQKKDRYDACLVAPGIIGSGEVRQKRLQGHLYARFTHYGPYYGLVEKAAILGAQWHLEGKLSLDRTKPYLCQFFKTDPHKLVTKVYVPLRQDS